VSPAVLQSAGDASDEGGAEPRATGETTGKGNESTTIVTKKRKRVAQDPNGPVQPLTVSGVFVVTNTKQTTRTYRAKFWDALSQTLIFEQDFSDELTSCEFSAITNILVCLSTRKPGAVRAFDLSTRKLKYRIKHESFDYMCNISFNVSGTKFVTHREMGENLYIWDAFSGCSVIEILTTRFSNFRARFTNDADCDRIISLDSNGLFHVWNADTGVSLSSFRGFADSVFGPGHIRVGNIAAAANHSWCAAYANGVLGIWNYQTAEQLFSNVTVIHNRMFAPACCFAFGPDDCSIISLTSNGLRAWDIAAGTLLFHCPDCGSHYSDVAFCPSSRSVFVQSMTSNRAVIEFDETTGNEIGTTGYESRVQWISFSSAPVAILL
jgi:WD40 repeat protein